MLNRSVKMVLLCLAICCLSFTAFAQTDESAPARTVPKNAMIYLEADNLLELLSGVAASHAQQETILDVALDLNQNDRALMKQSRLALAVLKKRGGEINKSSNLPISFVAILQTPDNQLTGKLCNMVKDTFKSLAGGNSLKVQISPINGRENIVALGDPDDVAAFLASLPQQKEDSLDSSAEFHRLKSRTDNGNIFVYTNGAELASMVNLIPGSAKEKGDIALAMKFLGLSALRAGAANFSTVAGQQGRLSLIVDGNKAGLLPMFATVPLSNFPAARYAPADAQLFFTVKLDAVKIYDNFVQTFFANGLTAGQDPLGAMIGPNAHKDLLENLTGEAAVALSITNIEELFEKNANPKFQVVGMFEVKDRAAIQPVVGHLASFEPVPAEKYNGVEVYGDVYKAWAYLDNFLILGNSEDVKHAIDAMRANKTLAATSAYQETLKQFAAGGLGMLYLNIAPVARKSPPYARLILGSILGSLPAQLALFAGRNDDEIYLQPSLTGTGSSFVVFGAMSAAVAIPNLLASRRSANGASAIEALRVFHTVETAYQSGIGNGKFGSAADLFKQDFIDAVLADAVGVPSMTSIGGSICPGTGQPKSGYLFKLEVTDKGRKFHATAVPAATAGMARTGDKSFFVDETGVVRETYEPRPANANDPPLDN